MTNTIASIKFPEGFLPCMAFNIRETEHTYPIKDEPWANWYNFWLRASYKLRIHLAQEGKTAKSFAATGTSNGIDALVANLTFREIERIVLIDLDERVVPIAEENVRRFFKTKEIMAFAGSLVEPLIQRRINVDVVYANLPILPNGGDLTQGCRRSSRYEKGLFAGAKTEDWIKKYLLEVYYVLLVQAKGVLNHGGSVICAIGGRIPYSVIEKVIEEAGFKAEELLTGFKVQTEPWEVFSGFADAEKDGVTFDFYRYDEAVAALRSYRLESGRNLDEPFIELDKEELRKIIEPYKITAKQVHKMYLRNNYAKIGHVVHMVRAVKND